MRFKLDRHNLIYIPVKVIHGSAVEIEAVIDTGSAGTVFDINLFNLDLFQPDSEVVQIVGIGGSEEVLVQSVELIQIGEKQLNNFRAQFGDLSGDLGFGGILGGDLLKQLGALIDYSCQTLEFVG